MNVNIDIDRILEAGAKAVDTAKKTATDLAREAWPKTARRTAPWWKNTSPPSARWTTRSTS